MDCPRCGEQLPKPVIEHIVYDRYGMSNVWVDLEIMRCPCGNVVRKRPHMSEKLVAHILRQTRPLSGEQIRFLKGHFKLKGVELAGLLGKNQATIYRYESGAQTPRPSTERLIRLICAAQLDMNIKELIDIFPRIKPGGPVEIHVYPKENRIEEIPARPDDGSDDRE